MKEYKSIEAAVKDYVLKRDRLRAWTAKRDDEEEKRKAHEDWKEKHEPTATNPIKMSKKLTVFSNEFEYKGVVYPFTQIEKIYFYWKRNTRVPLGLSSDLGWEGGEDMDIRIKVDSNDEELTANTWTYKKHGSDKYIIGTIEKKSLYKFYLFYRESRKEINCY